MADIKLGTDSIYRVKFGEQTVQKIALGNTQIWPPDGGGYYDCGYGCQFFTYNPGCTNCSTYYYIVNVKVCGSCTTIQSNLNIRSLYTLTVGKFYFDYTSGYIHQIVSTGGNGATSVDYDATIYDTCSSISC